MAELNFDSDNVHIRRSGEHTAVLGRVCPRCHKQYDNLVQTCPEDGSLLMPVLGDLVEEFVLANRFAVHMLVTQGATTSVYKGEDLVTQGYVAIKVLRSHLWGDRKTAKKFEEGIPTACELSHKNIVTPIAFGTMPVGQPFFGRPYIVMDFLRGRTLAKTMNPKGRVYSPAVAHQANRLPLHIAVPMFIEIVDALEYAASMGVLHKDIKPSNIFLVKTDTATIAKLVDFGFAERLFRALEWTPQTMRTTSLYGNAHYLAPEFGTRGVEPTVQSEMYSLGCVMYEALTDSPPFMGNNDFDTILKSMNDEPARFKKALDLPEKLESAVLRCLDKKPENRFGSFRELHEELVALGVNRKDIGNEKPPAHHVLESGGQTRVEG